jgi:ATP-dependent Clp protease ATP-binding subunit ClpB
MQTKLNKARCPFEEEKMRFDRFTLKSQELIQNAQTLASTHGNQQIEPVHLLAAMLEEKEGVARSVFQRLGASGDEHRQLSGHSHRPAAQGQRRGDVYLSSYSQAVLEAAFAEAGKMKDEYTSIEHILLALCDKKRETRRAS